MGDGHLDTILATESNEFIKSGVETLIPIPNQIEDFSESNEEFSSIDDDSFFIDNIDYVEAPPPDSELISSEVIEIVIPEETNTFDNSLPEFEAFCFDVEEISSGSTTTPSDISLSEYEAFYDDHVKEISSGSPTTHSDSPLYASFIFDLSINPVPPADRSDFYEFTNELSPFISPPDESLFAYVVWIFLPFLVYSVPPHYLLSLRTEDIIFDLGICKSTFSRPDISHRCRTVKKFNTHHSHLNKCPMLIHGQNNPILDVLLFHFYPP
nr:hypothetical protein [Tanacetum cinerariifolium]